MSRHGGLGFAMTAIAILACADRVAAPPGPPIPAVRFSGAGDIATCYRQSDSATAAILDSVGGAVFTAGDNLHDNADTASYGTCYGRSWGRVLDRTHPAIGNHDYDKDSGAQYFTYFGARAGEPGRGYYSFDLGGWHVVMLNSHAAVIGTGPGSAQERWLRADLRENRRRCTIAVWHHPRFYQGSFNRNLGARAFWAALHEARAEVVVNGHFHLYERYAPQDADAKASASGPRQFTVGTGGRGLDVQSQAAPNLEFRQNTDYGVLSFELGDGWYRWEFISAARAVLDSGRAECR